MILLQKKIEAFEIKKFTRYTDSKLQFFYIDVVNGQKVAVKGLPKDAEKKMKKMIGRIKPLQGRRYFEQVLIDDCQPFPCPSYNDFTRPEYLKLNVNSFLLDVNALHEYTFASKGRYGHESSAGPRSIIYWLLGELFAVDKAIIAAYSFIDAGNMGSNIPFYSFLISEIEKEKLLYGARAIPEFHGVEIYTHKLWRDRQPIKWESFDLLQTDEDAAVLGAHKTGKYNLNEIRPSLEWLHEMYIECELKNNIDNLSIIPS